MENKSEIQSALADIKSTVQEFSDAQRKFQAQLDAVDLRSQNNTRPTWDGRGDDLLTKSLQESDELKRLVANHKGHAIINIGNLNQIPMERKLLTVSGNVGTAGVIAPEQVAPTVPLAQRRLFLRDLLYRGTTTTSSAVSFIQESTFVNATSPQPSEGYLKNETTNTFTTKQLPVVTLAHFLMASRQLLDDAPALAEYVKTKLLFGLRYKEEAFALAGDGTNGNLTGLLTVAAPFNTSLLPSGSSYTRLDILRRALQQVEMSDEVPAGFFCLNPVDVANVELLKSTLGTYIVGDPGGSATAPLTLWGKPVINTTAIAAGTFLCGSSTSAELIDRLDATVEISFEDRDNFIRNQATLLCEERTVLCVYRPNAFVSGSLTTSPAS